MKKQELLFIHGGGEGAYEEDKKLALYLKDALKDLCTVNYPRMPDENNPDYETYNAKIDEELKKIKGKVILVGHSLGSCFLLKYLSETIVVKELVGVFLIATPFWGGDGWQYEGFRLQQDFTSKLPAKTPIFFYHGTYDEIVPFLHLELYEKKLPYATFRKIDGGGHQLNNNLSEVARDIRNLNY